jgi:hypothetical protein
MRDGLLVLVTVVGTCAIASALMLAVAVERLVEEIRKQGGRR